MKIFEFLPLMKKIKSCDDSLLEEKSQLLDEIFSARLKQWCIASQKTDNNIPLPEITFDDFEKVFKYCRYHFGISIPKDIDDCGCLCECKSCTIDLDIKYTYMLEEIPLATVAHEKDCLIENCNGCWQP